MRQSYPFLKNQQQGFSLLVVLVIMVVIAFMVVAGAQTINTEMRLSTHDADRKVAMNYAEAALRAAEGTVANINVLMLTNELNNRPNVDGIVETMGNGSNGRFRNDCTGGLCTPAMIYMQQQVSASGAVTTTQIAYGNGIPAWERADVFIGARNKSLEYTQMPDNVMARKPRYIIEFLGKNQQGQYNYRVTVRAWGQNSNTMVTLQSYVQVGVS